MALICVKRLKFLRNALEKWLRYVKNGIHVSEGGEISGKLLRNVRKGLSMWEMT